MISVWSIPKRPAGASKVALIGYSFGAGILAFGFDGLTPEAKHPVVQISLLGFARTTNFEISITGWLGEAANKDAAPTKPALASIDPRMIQYGHRGNVCEMGVSKR
jgi:type IV secretory pathway VirJ component